MRRVLLIWAASLLPPRLVACSDRCTAEPTPDQAVTPDAPPPPQAGAPDHPPVTRDPRADAPAGGGWTASWPWGARSGWGVYASHSMAGVPRESPADGSITCGR